jgi:hypothetical protein
VIISEVMSSSARDPPPAAGRGRSLRKQSDLSSALSQLAQHLRGRPAVTAAVSSVVAAVINRSTSGSNVPGAVAPTSNERAVSRGPPAIPPLMSLNVRPPACMRRPVTTTTSTSVHHEATRPALTQRSTTTAAHARRAQERREARVLTKAIHKPEVADRNVMCCDNTVYVQVNSATSYGQPSTPREDIMTPQVMRRLSKRYQHRQDTTPYSVPTAFSYGGGYASGPQHYDSEEDNDMGRTELTRGSPV